MGRVYRAEQLATGKAVALKLLHPEFVGVEQVVRRFEREAKVMTEVAHPGIVKVIDKCVSCHARHEITPGSRPVRWNARAL